MCSKKETHHSPGTIFYTNEALSFTFMTHVSGTALSTQNALIHLVNVYFNSL